MCEQKGRAKPLLGPVMQLSASRKGGKGGKKGGKGKKGGTAIAKKDGDDKPRQTSQVLDTDKREYIYQLSCIVREGLLIPPPGPQMYKLGKAVPSGKKILDNINLSFYPGSALY
eukprot:253225-Rhodomonas_salina.3